MQFKETGNLKTHMRGVKHVRLYYCRKIRGDSIASSVIRLSLPRAIWILINFLIKGRSHLRAKLLTAINDIPDGVD